MTDSTESAAIAQRRTVSSPIRQRLDGTLRSDERYLSLVFAIVVASDDNCILYWIFPSKRPHFRSSAVARVMWKVIQYVACVMFCFDFEESLGAGDVCFKIEPP